MQRAGDAPETAAIRRSGWNLRACSLGFSLVVAVVVVVPGRQRCDLAGTGIDRGRIDHAAIVEHPRKRALPMLVVDVFVSGGGAGRPPRDLVDEVRAELPQANTPARATPSSRRTVGVPRARRTPALRCGTVALRARRGPDRQSSDVLAGARWPRSARRRRSSRRASPAGRALPHRARRCRAAARHNQVAELGGRVPDLDLGALAGGLGLGLGCQAASAGVTVMTQPGLSFWPGGSGSPAWPGGFHGTPRRSRRQGSV